MSHAAFIKPSIGALRRVDTVLIGSSIGEPSQTMRRTAAVPRKRAAHAGVGPLKPTTRLSSKSALNPRPALMSMGMA